MGGLIYYLTNTAAKYYRSLIELTLINSCYCDISPVQWQIFQWLLFQNKAYIRTLLSETGRYQLCIDSIMWCGVIREMKLGRKPIIGGNKRNPI